MSEQTARRTVMARNNGMCEAQIAGVCQGRATNYQHRKLRKHCARQELWLPSNGLAVCGSGTTGCHGWMTSGHVAEAHDWGWDVRSAWDPWEWRVWIHNPNHVGGTWYFLNDDGSVEFVSDEYTRKRERFEEVAA